MLFVGLPYAGFLGLIHAIMLGILYASADGRRVFRALFDGGGWR